MKVGGRRADCHGDYCTGTEMTISAAEKNPQQRRRFFRLSYPTTSRPPFRTADSSPYRVLEIAENSLLIEQKPDRLLRRGEVLAGEVVFHDMASEHVVGEVFRHDDRGVVILLSKGISLRHVISEQVYIKSKFPLFFAAIYQPDH